MGWCTAFAILSLGLIAHAHDKDDRRGGVHWVGESGVDDPRGGTQHKPWRTIAFAAKRVADGSTILVRPGTYLGRVSLEKKFSRSITIRSEVPYRALLRNREKVVFCYGCAGVTMEGFDIAHGGPGAGALVVQIDGAGEDAKGGPRGGHFTLRNNVIHDSFNNDLLKINNGAHDVRVQGNVFYNQHGRDEHIDANSVENVTIEDNIFFNDFEGSGRPIAKDTASYVLIKDSNENDDGVLGSRNVIIRRNVFLGWQGGRAYGFLLLGEDGKPYYEASDVLIENNLFLGNSPIEMRSPFGVKGARAARFRNNTVVGDLPGSAFVTRINREQANQPGEGIDFHNNVWSDPTGTMADFSDTEERDVKSFVLANNVYWNGGAAIPAEREDVVNIAADRTRLIANPRLPNATGPILCRWVPERSAFADGSRTIEEARLRLIERHARPDTGSPLVDRATPAQSASEDIRGRRRGARPDVGAYELEAVSPRPSPPQK